MTTAHPTERRHIGPYITLAVAVASLLGFSAVVTAVLWGWVA